MRVGEVEFPEDYDVHKVPVGESKAISDYKLVYAEVTKEYVTSRRYVQHKNYTYRDLMVFLVSAPIVDAICGKIIKYQQDTKLSWTVLDNLTPEAQQELNVMLKRLHELEVTLTYRNSLHDMVSSALQEVLNEYKLKIGDTVSSFLKKFKIY